MTGMKPKITPPTIGPANVPLPPVITMMTIVTHVEVKPGSDNGALLVTARQALALVQMPEGKPTRLPTDWAQRWG